MKHLVLAWIAALIGLGQANIAATDDNTVRIMPLGDSITQGNRAQNSYRRPLWHKLQAANLKVDFVGSQRRNHWGGPPDPDFDLDHEGHWGWRVDQVLARLDKWAVAARPDIVLVHLGTNDLAQGKSVRQITDELTQLVGILRKRNPHVVVMLARIVGNAHLEQQIAALNKAIAAIPRHDASGHSPIIIVDQNTGFDPRIHTYDGTHPNDAGEEHMAERWFAGLANLLKNSGELPPGQDPQSQ